MQGTRKMDKIFVVEDDDEHFIELQKALLKVSDKLDAQKIERFVYSDVAIENITDNEPLAFIIDLILPKNAIEKEPNFENGLVVFDTIAEKYPLAPVVVASAVGEIPFSFVEAFQKKANCSTVDKGKGFNAIAEEIRLILMSKISEMRLAIYKFEEMLNNQEKCLEKDFQEFLKDKLWFFGTTKYIDIIPHDRPDVGEVVDLLLKRSDGFYDVYELKQPKFPIFKEYSTGRNYLSDKSAEAIGQLIEYINSYNMEYYKHFTKGKNIYLPKGYVVIGKHNEDEKVKERLRLENSNFKFIEIITFDDLLERAKGAILLFQSV